MEYRCEFGPCVEMADGKMLCNLLPDCGCAGATMRKAYQRALELLEKNNLEALHAEFKLDAEPRLFYSVLMILDDRDLIDHGSSIRCPWLTERGEEALRLMREHWPQEDGS